MGRGILPDGHSEAVSIFAAAWTWRQGGREGGRDDGAPACEYVPYRHVRPSDNADRGPADGRWAAIELAQPGASSMSASAGQRWGEGAGRTAFANSRCFGPWALDLKTLESRPVASPERARLPPSARHASAVEAAKSNLYLQVGRPLAARLSQQL